MFIIGVVVCRLEVRPHQVKSVFLTATKLKMERVVKECARYLVEYLDPDNCIEIRSLPGIARNKVFVGQVNSYIAQQVPVIQSSRHYIVLHAKLLRNIKGREATPLLLS